MSLVLTDVKFALAQPLVPTAMRSLIQSTSPHVSLISNVLSKDLKDNTFTITIHEELDVQMNVQHQIQFTQYELILQVNMHQCVDTAVRDVFHVKKMMIIRI